MRTKWFVPVALLAASGVVIWDGVRIVIKHQSAPGGLEVGGYEALLGVFLAVLTIAYGIQLKSHDARPASQPPSAQMDRRVWIGLALLAAYVALLSELGYVISTTLFLLAFLRTFDGYRWVSMILGAGAMSAISAYGLTLLGSPMPRGVFY